MSRTIMDSGPLVAWFAKRDSHYEWAARVIDDLPVGALVCEAVLAEVCHLVAKDGVPAPAVLKLVEQNDLVLVSLVGEISAIRALMERKRAASRFSIRPFYTDACFSGKHWQSAVKAQGSQNPYKQRENQRLSTIAKSTRRT
jgi:predicted nucleic acid-binding protein